MKKFIAIPVMFAVVCSCSDSAKDLTGLEFSQTICGTSANDHSVHLEDVVTLTRAQTNNTRAFSDVKARICCYEDEKHDTLLYICNHDKGGWTIYSSDTRVPAIVAHSDSGSFDSLKQIDGARMWIESIAEDMAIIKTLPDEKLNFTGNEIACNKAFWESISSPDKYVKENLLKSTRAEHILIKGHYEYRFSTSDSEVYDSISRMIVTNWNQNEPYNIYCPLKSNSTNNHAPAGCAAIAGAQMLYYLHDYYGVPSTAPSEAYCNGNINSYSWDQTNYTTDVWNNMYSNGYYAAPLIANVGKRLGMEYGNDASGAKLSDLVSKVFAPYGISSTYTEYNSELLKNSLLNGMPVLLGALSNYTTNTGTENVGHAFIADRYKRTRIVTKNYYEWVYDSYPPLTPIPAPTVPVIIEYTYSSPTIDMIGINWGWGSYYNVPSEWFTLTGDWISSRPSMSSYNWNIDRRMIYNFQVINN